MEKIIIQGLSAAKSGSTMLKPGPYAWEVEDAEVTFKDDMPNALVVHVKCLDGTKQDDGTSAAGVKRNITLFLPKPSDPNKMNLNKLGSFVKSIDLDDGADGLPDPALMAGRTFACGVTWYKPKNKDREYESYDNFRKFSPDF